MIKLLSSVLLGALILSSCGNSSENTSDQSSNAAGSEAGQTSTADAETTEEVEEVAEIPSDVPEQPSGRCPPESDWPEGMVCIEGGTFTLGFDQGQPDEQTPGEVTVSSFFMDLHEVTNGDFEACIASKQCKRPMRYRNFMDERQPIVAVSWADARAYCSMVGKRLPTEAEWERAASGPEHTQYPWGNEPGGCEKAQITDGRGHGCGTDLTLLVGSKEAGHYGLFDMAGNVHEWVADWYSPCLRGCDGECGDECFGENPKGPCGGKSPCEGRTKRSIRGGSWYWPEERARSTARRGAYPENVQNHRFGFRCARDLGTDQDQSTATKSSEPQEQISEPQEQNTEAQRPEIQSKFAPLSDKARDILRNLPSEKLKMPSDHYYHSNEWRHDLIREHLEGLGGAYIGVGADQNYTMAALARSELLLLVDFDPRIPRLHKIYEVLVTHSETPDELVERFAEDSVDSTVKLLDRELEDDENKEATIKQYKRFRDRWLIYLRRVRRLKRRGEPFGWLAQQERYNYIRTLFSEGRVVARAGDVTSELALRSMGQALRSIEIPAQIVYFSNAEQFFPYSPSFVENIKSIPTTEKSIVVRTTRHPRLPNAKSDGWHYIIHDFSDFQQRLDSGDYPRASLLLTDLLGSGLRYVGKKGVSIMNSDVPRVSVKGSKTKQ